MGIGRRYVYTGLKSVGKQAGRYVASSVARSAVRYGSRLARMAIKKAGGAVPTMFGSRIGTNESPVVTYRTGGRRLSKRARRFRNRVLEAVNGTAPIQSYLTDNCYSVKTITADQVTMDAAGLCTLAIGTGNSNDDVRQMFYNAYTLATDAACIGYKLQFRSAVMDVNWTNTGAGGVILDIYTMICRKSYITITTNPDTQFTAQFAEQGGTLAITNPAVTPFQNPGFLQYWKIIAHKTVHLKTGEVCNMQVRQNRRKWLDGKCLTQNVNAIPGWTKIVFFQMRGEVENNAGTARYSGGTVAWKARKTYTYQFPADRNRVTQVDQ